MKKEKCFVCKKELDADNCYGTKEMPFCRVHHESYAFLLAFLVAGGRPKDLANAHPDTGEDEYSSRQE